MFVTYVPDADPIDRVFVDPASSVWTFAEHPLSRACEEGDHHASLWPDLLAQEYDHLEARLIFDLAQPVVPTCVRWVGAHVPFRSDLTKPTQADLVRNDRRWSTGSSVAARI